MRPRIRSGAAWGWGLGEWRNGCLLPDLARDKSGRACLPPAGAFRARQSGAPGFPNGRLAAARPLLNGVSPFEQ